MLARHKIQHVLHCPPLVIFFLPVDIDVADLFGERFALLVNEYKSTLDQIFNTDETGLYWSCLSTHTLAGCDEKNASGFKMNKEQLTVLLCANASGGGTVV